MSRNTKIALGIIGGIVVLCVLVVVAGIVLVSMVGPSMVENMVIEDPAEVGEAAGEIADYDLPPGYEEKMVMNIFVGKIVAIGSVDQPTGLGKPVIMLMQISTSVTGSQADQESFRRQMQQSLERQAAQDQVSLELVDEEVVEIDGQDVNLSTYEGENEDGNRVRQIVSDFFEVKDKNMMLMIMGQAEDWPEEDIDAFIVSIH